MEPIRILDLNDDILCDVLRRVAATEDGLPGGSEGFLPLLKVGAGRANLDSFALLQIAATCKRFRHVVCTVLPTRLAVRLKLRADAERSLKNSVGRFLPPKSVSAPLAAFRWWKVGQATSKLSTGGSSKSVGRVPFTSADEVDVGTIVKPALQAWMRPESCLANRGIGATPAGLSMDTCKSFMAMQFVRNLDVVTCRLEPPVGCLGAMANMTQLTGLAFSLHSGVTDAALQQLSKLTGMESLSIICDTAPRVDVQSIARMLKSLPRLSCLTIDSSRSLAEAALVALEHLSNLTSLDLMRCNPDCKLFFSTTPAAAPPSKRSVPDSPSPDVRGDPRGEGASLAGVLPDSPIATPASTTTGTPVATTSSSFSAAPSKHLVVHASNRHGTAATFPVAYPGMLHPPENALHDIVATRINVPENLKSHKLRQLRLSHLVQSSSESIMALLSRFPALAALELMFCERATSAALEPLAMLPSLQRLVLYACPRVDKNVTPREATVPALQELDLSNTVHATDALLHHLAGGSVEEGGGLRALILDSCSKITVEGIARLTRFQNLRTLSVAFMLSMRDADLATICSAHPQLEALSLEGCVSLTDACLTVLAEKLPSLKQLDATSIKVRDAGVQGLAPLRHLAALRLRPQIERDTFRLLVKRSDAPVWPLLVAAPKSHRWSAGFQSSRVGSFASRCWKIPGDSMEDLPPHCQ